ncbi:hypothetical protein [Candidatus Methylacidiphilum fumarolicum]|nr:hypothetical protein [Candidatus Methylacidiphilum fumarolicum]
MGLEHGKRIVIPLVGKLKIRGMICLVLKEKKAVISYVAPLKVPKRLDGEIVGIDMGLSEAFTDDKGKKYGKGVGKVLAKLSKQYTEKGRKRQKLHAICKKTKDKAKARGVGKNNLGRKKLAERLHKVPAEIESRVTTSLRKLLKLRSPSMIVFRGFTHLWEIAKQRAFQAHPPDANRCASGSNRFLAPGGRFSAREEVNLAYSSWALSLVRVYVHSKNRIGDKLACRHYKYVSYVDRVGGIQPQEKGRRSGDRLVDAAGTPACDPSC